MNLNEKDIKTVADFTKYAKDILKNAHGDNYDDGIAQETVDGLVSKYGEDYGAMIGALTSGLGEELNEGKMPTFKKPRNIKMDDDIYQQLADAIYKSISYLGADMIENSLPLNTASLWQIVRYATNRIWMTDDNANLRSGRHGINHDDEWLVKTRKYTDANFESATKSILKTMFGKKVTESKLNEGQDDWYGDSKSMRNFVVRQMSSGMVSNVVKVTKYDDIDLIRKEMGQILSKNDMKYSSENFHKLVKDVYRSLVKKGLLKESKLNEGKSKHGFEKTSHQSKRAFDEFVNATNRWSFDLVVGQIVGAFEDEELIGFANMFKNSADAWTKEFERQAKLKESKVNEGKKMQFEDVKVGFFQGTYNTIWSGDMQVESEMDYLNMEVADELKEMFGELDFIGFEFEYGDFDWGFEELNQGIPEYVSASFEELLSDIDIDGNVGKSRMSSPKFYNYSTDEIYCNVTIDYDLIDVAIADLVEEDDDYSLLQYLTKDNNTAYIYTNYGELESDLMRGDSIALEVLIKVLSEMRIGDEYEVRKNYEYSAYEEWSGNTSLGRTVSGNLEFRLENEIDDEGVVAKIVKHIEDNV